MSWTDERVALLKRLWGEGKTAAEIAKELGGVTRNAVIGKAHRLKLSNRVSPIQQNKKPVAKPVVAVKKVEKPPAINDDDRQGIPLTNLEASQCRWPIGDPREESFGFCGDEKMAGLPYCSDHAKVAYQAATRNRILQAENQGKAAADKAQKAQPKLKKAANQ